MGKQPFQWHLQYENYIGTDISPTLGVFSLFKLKRPRVEGGYLSFPENQRLPVSGIPPSYSSTQWRDCGVPHP